MEFCTIICSLETPSPDPLNIAELVKEPVRAIDFCYHDEDNDVTVLDCISMCVMVVSYSAESCRGYQMLVSPSQCFNTLPMNISTETSRSFWKQFCLITWTKSKTPFISQTRLNGSRKTKKTLLINSPLPFDVLSKIAPN